jgi:hypothetical protein
MQINKQRGSTCDERVTVPEIDVRWPMRSVFRSRMLQRRHATTVSVRSCSVARCSGGSDSCCTTRKKQHLQRGRQAAASPDREAHSILLQGYHAIGLATEMHKHDLPVLDVIVVKRDIKELQIFAVLLLPAHLRAGITKHRTHARFNGGSVRSRHARLSSAGRK